MPQLFTLDEARALLPEVRTLAEAMQRRKRALDRVHEVAADAGSHAAGNGHGPKEALSARAQAEQLVEEIQARIERLARLGVEVKGLDDGLVDFPSERGGRVVYLCWRVGEPEIAWWHDLDAGFRGRQPL